MAEENIKVTAFETKDSAMSDALIEHYRVNNANIDFATIQDSIAEDAAEGRKLPNAGDYSWATDVGFAYLYNYDKIKAAQTKTTADGKTVAPKPLANDEIYGKIKEAADKRQQKANERKAKEEAEKRAAAAEGREYVKPGDQYVSPITLGPKGDYALAKLNDSLAQLQERAEKTAILKIVIVHQPLSKRIVNKENPTISLPVNVKMKKREAIVADEDRLVQDPENIEAYKTILAYIEGPDSATLKANVGKDSKAWGGVYVQMWDGKKILMTKQVLFDYVSKAGMYINYNDESRPGAKIRWITKKNSKNSQGEQEKTPVVSLTHMAAVRKPGADFYAYATDLDTSAQTEKTASSEVSYKVYVYDKTTNKQVFNDDNTPKTRTKRAPGLIKVYGEKHVNPYWDAAFEKSAKTSSIPAESKKMANAIRSGLDAMAQFAMNFDNSKSDPQRIGAPVASANDQVNSYIMDTINAINFNDFGKDGGAGAADDAERAD